MLCTLFIIDKEWEEKTQTRREVLRSKSPTERGHNGVCILLYNQVLSALLSAESAYVAYTQLLLADKNKIKAAKKTTFPFDSIFSVEENFKQILNI